MLPKQTLLEFFQALPFTEVLTEFNLTVEVTPNNDPEFPYLITNATGEFKEISPGLTTLPGDESTAFNHYYTREVLDALLDQRTHMVLYAAGYNTTAVINMKMEYSHALGVYRPALTIMTRI